VAPGSPSPLGGERAGVRGETSLRIRLPWRQRCLTPHPRSLSPPRGEGRSHHAVCQIRGPVELRRQITGGALQPVLFHGRILFWTQTPVQHYFRCRGNFGRISEFGSGTETCGRSADFQSAVSPSCTRPGVRAERPLRIPRTPGRIQFCDTAECNSALPGTRRQELPICFPNFAALPTDRIYFSAFNRFKSSARNWATSLKRGTLSG
jgi:hypothetical protein